MTPETREVECERCEATAAFVVYEPVNDVWRALCEQHTRTLHPSLEVKAWLESRYAKPIEFGHPETPPDEPVGGRASAFRELVDSTMNWDDSPDRPD